VELRKPTKNLSQKRRTSSPEQ